MSGPGAGGGSLTFWVDGVEQYALTGLENDERYVEYVQLGAGLVDSGTYGAIYFDAFESNRAHYIGLASLGLLQAASSPGGKVLAAHVPEFLEPERAPSGLPLASGGASTTTVSYDYDPLGRLTQAEYSDGRFFRYTYDATNRLASVNGVPYTWDDNGNLLSDGVNSYTYDAANRLVAVSSPQSAISYRYNGLGDRLEETVNGETTRFAMDLAGGLTQVLADGTNT